MQRVVCTMLAVAALSIGASNEMRAQNQPVRKLGPDAVASIQEAVPDPAFATTTINRIAVLPFANRMEYKDAADIISKRLVSQLGQLQPQYKVTSPEELINFLTEAKLEDSFNVFLGDFLNDNVAKQPFLGTLKAKLDIDAVLLGRITSYGIAKSGLLGRQYIVGVELGLYRVSDARRIWIGRDRLAASKATALPQAAEAVGEVFARFLGRLARS